VAAAHPHAWKNPLGRPPHSIAQSALTTGPSTFPYDANVANSLDTGGHSNGATLLRCGRTESAPVAASRVLKSGKRDRGTPLCRARMIPPMTFSTKAIEGNAIVILGLPRTGTTALAQLISADPQIRSLRTWESPAADGIAMVEQMFPDFQKRINSEPEGAPECQDLMGVSFRTFHIDGVVRVPGYVTWLSSCVMRETHMFRRDVLALLQWHCKLEVFPNAKSLWSHRDLAKVLGSVRSLITSVRSWSSDRNDLRTDPVNTVARSHAQLALTFSDAARASAQDWAAGHKPGHRGTHAYDLADFGLTPEHIREAFSNYLGTNDASA
jgi:hypothetical protein